MARLVGVLFAQATTRARSAREKARVDPKRPAIADGIDALIDGVEEVVVFSPAPDHLRSALHGRRFRRRRSLRRWDPRNGHAPALLGLRELLDQNEALIAANPALTRDPPTVPRGSGNCILFVEANGSPGQRIDLIEIAYRDGRNPVQFAVRDVGRAGNYAHTGFTYIPANHIELLERLSVERDLAPHGHSLELTQMSHLARVKSRAAHIRDVHGVDLWDLVRRYLAIGNLTAIKR